MKRGSGKIQDRAGKVGTTSYMLEVRRDADGKRVVSGLLLSITEADELDLEHEVTLTLVTGEEFQISLSTVGALAGPPFSFRVDSVPAGVFPHF